eukprot:Pgem_evm1s17936
MDSSNENKHTINDLVNLDIKPWANEFYCYLTEMHSSENYTFVYDVKNYIKQCDRLYEDCKSNLLIDNSENTT